MIDHEKRQGWNYTRRPVTDETKAKISAALKANKAARAKASRVANRMTRRGRRNAK